jgi:hypothetical protein
MVGYSHSSTVVSPMAGRKPPHEARGPTALPRCGTSRHRLLVAEGNGWSRRPTSSSPTPARIGPGPSGSPGSWKPTATRGRGSGMGLIAGHNWVHEVQQATAMAERVVAVLSTTYLQSGHGEAEWRAFYAGRRAGSRPRRRSFPATGGRRSAPPRRPGSRASLMQPIGQFVASVNGPANAVPAIHTGGPPCELPSHPNEVD